MARPTEIAAIRDLLEAEHPDVETLARAVIEELDAVRLTRPTFVIRLAWPDGERFGVGPFENRQQARTHLIGTRDRQGIVPGLSREEQDAVIVELKPPGWWAGEVATPAKDVCPECQHPRHAHNWPKYAKKRAGCIVSLTPKGPVGHDLCPCEGSGT